MHAPFQISSKTLLLSVAAVAILCTATGWFLTAQANDLWNYGKLGVSNGTGQGPVYYVEVYGVGEQPTVARIVRFSDPADAPRNALEVSHRFSTDLAVHVRNLDRWNNTLTVVAGRTNDEMIEMEIDAVVARTLFAKPGARFEKFGFCDAFWRKYVAPNMPAGR